MKYLYKVIDCYISASNFCSLFKFFFLKRSVTYIKIKSNQNYINI